MGGPFVRIERVVTGSVWAVDAALRDQLRPRYQACDELLAVWAGRHGPELDDERIVASVWASAAGESRAPGVAALFDATDDGPTTVSVTVLPIALYEVFARPGPATILRVYQGQTKPGELDAYVQEAHRGVRLDGASPQGPASVCMSREGPDRFVTVSTWTDWDALASCTGGDIHRPLATRDASRLIAGGPTHYELMVSTIPSA